MRKVIVSIYTSIDGFIIGPNGEMDWVFKYADAGSEKHSEDIVDSIDLILLGRVLSDEFLPYWANDKSEFGTKIRDIPKIVFSRTLDKVGYKDVKIIKENIREEISKIKSQPGKDIVLYGGAEIVTVFTNLGLVDEFHLFVTPVILGGGKHLFAGLNSNCSLSLMATNKYDSGTVLLIYKPKII
ncbi:MAG: dihydrofolate reductase family protein [Bacteroidota bacterium]|nr:dihydrofolate reductase family protein [Bacteroidota bacterium]